jgi:hypothetical protein
MFASLPVYGHRKTHKGWSDLNGTSGTDKGSTGYCKTPYLGQELRYVDEASKERILLLLGLGNTSSAVAKDIICADACKIHA